MCLCATRWVCVCVCVWRIVCLSLSLFTNLLFSLASYWFHVTATFSALVPFPLHSAVHPGSTLHGLAQSKTLRAGANGTLRPSETPNYTGNEHVQISEPTGLHLGVGNMELPNVTHSKNESKSRQRDKRSRAIGTYTPWFYYYIHIPKFLN